MSEQVRRERLEAIVHGHVQGVNFRYYTRQRAQELGLSGYVRNRWDGTVEVVAEGPPQALARLLDFLHRGPPSAVVVQVDVQWKPATGEFQGFRVAY
ncbi:MAG: acylphosphatase [Anaerolineae bacterium]